MRRIDCYVLSSTFYLYLILTYLHPGLLHMQRLLLHDQAFTQDMPASIEFLQRFEQEIQLEIGFGQLEMVLFTFGVL